LARPAHPKEHDKRLQKILLDALKTEKLVPCPDIATAKLIRSRFREIIRAHKEWDTGDYRHYRRIRTKIHHTHIVLPVRPNFSVDKERFPYILSLDAREIMDDILYQVEGQRSWTEDSFNRTSPPPLTRAPQNASATFLSSADFDDDDDEADPYELITSRYRTKDGENDDETDSGES